ncbi:MAG TPA: radical SAM protein [Candidatus Margulisiibacteriota bacterium]|nr:radical SAM protein [Candidatus Margulisiibacteriota bacterium]
MQGYFVESAKLPAMPLWGRIEGERKLLSFDLEITARCNNNCRHCYVNLPANDRMARKDELSLNGIKKIVDQALDLGALWCLITGGEPLLRKDFFDIYIYLKQKGLLVSVFSNATLLTKKHADFFKKYPPRDFEVTLYGVTQETYEKVTRTPGSFKAFMNGVKLLLEKGIKVRFKTMALRSNLNELPQIAQFCRERTKDYFRFDPFLHLRFDKNSKRNEEIKCERLSVEEIASIERADPERSQALKKDCAKLIFPGAKNTGCNHLFHCRAGSGSFSVSYDGYFRLCSSLLHPDCVYDLKNGRLEEVWGHFVSKVRDMRSNKAEFLKKCRKCPIVNLCAWCPAYAYLETGELDNPVDYFCKAAHARVAMVEKESSLL